MNADEQVYEAIARGLAAMREPDLSGFPADAVDFAMARAFTWTGPRPEWIAGIRERVAELSIGLVKLEDTDPARFPSLIKDSSTSYQQLTGVFATHLVVLGPFRRPVRFVKGPEADQ